MSVCCDETPKVHLRYSLHNSPPKLNHVSNGGQKTELVTKSCENPQPVKTDSPKGETTFEKGGTKCSEGREENNMDGTGGNFFSLMEHSFANLRPGPEDGAIETEEFLRVCRSLVVIFDEFNTSAFAPIKMDLNGNITKLEGHLGKDPASCSTLQSMLQREMEGKSTNASGSASDALLWLKRLPFAFALPVSFWSGIMSGLAFLEVFLRRFARGDVEVKKAVTEAYQETLRKYHGWIVRGVFAVASGALPSREAFQAQLIKSPSPPDSAAVVKLTADINAYVDGLKTILDALARFYAQNALDPDPL